MSLIEEQVNLVNTDSIDYDPQNPRGETEQEITSEISYDKLKNSISNYGILEPLVIKSKGDSSANYVLIDGERRLRAAKELEKEKVPAVTAKDEVDGLKLAYQIHMHRKPWTKIAEIKAIERIIKSIKALNPNITEGNLKKEIKEITNHSKSTIEEFFVILKYDDSIIEKVKSGLVNYSYLIRIEADFIIPLKKFYEEIILELGEDTVRTTMIHKAELGLLIHTRFMMNSDFRIIFQYPLLKERIERVIVDFLTTDIQSIDDLLNSVKVIITENPESAIKSEDIDNSEKNDQPQGSQNNEENPKNLGEDVSNENIVTNRGKKSSKQKQTSILDIKRKIEAILDSLSIEEREYISEALDCLATRTCLKASVLMIWASGISRILSYINRDLIGFNATCTQMKSTPKSFYKHYVSNFQTASTSIDEIREASRDMQLICFLAYKNIISTSDFKKLKAHYDIRNDCAHPTSIKLTISEVIVVFENVHKLIFDNPKLV